MLRSGFARTDITPPLGIPLAGYYEMRYADGVLDPLYLNALALNDGEMTVVIITADVLMIRLDVCDTLREMISESTGIPAHHIMINSLHTHTSLRIGGKVGKGSVVVSDTSYLDVLYRKFCDVARMAIDDMPDSTFGIGVKHATEDISFVRRYLMKDGSLKTNPSAYTPDEIERPAAMSDNDVRLIKFVREGKNDIALVNFCTHPDVIGKTKISADWPGFVRRFVESDHQNTSCIFMNGFQGDTNHINYQIERKYRHRGYAHSEKMGRVIADTVNLMWDSTIPQDDYRLYAEMRSVFNKCSTRGEEHYEECRKFVDKYRNGDYSEKQTPSGILLAEACRIAELPEQPVYHRIPITCLSLGKVAFVGVGGEPFTEYGYNMRQRCPDRFIITATCANGGEGYLPSKTAFEQGGYEVISSHFTPELEDTVMTATVEMIDR